MVHDDVVHDPFGNIVFTPHNDTWVHAKANPSLG